MNGIIHENQSVMEALGGGNVAMASSDGAGSPALVTALEKEGFNVEPAVLKPSEVTVAPQAPAPVAPAPDTPTFG